MAIELFSLLYQVEILCQTRTQFFGVLCFATQNFSCPTNARASPFQNARERGCNVVVVNLVEENVESLQLGERTASVNVEGALPSESEYHAVPVVCR